MKMKKNLIVLISGLFVIALFAFTTKSVNQQKPWPVPEAAKNKVNPRKGDAASLKDGKTLYDTHCKSCHGTKGKGDGSKAATLDTECGDFTTAAFHNQTDGELYYKTSEGRKDMPSFKKKIPDADDLWAVVNFLRTLK
jgi:mono/diheme cytochrome c family protein